MAGIQGNGNGKLTKEQKKGLFTAYDAAQQKVNKAQAALDAAKAECEVTVKAIHSALGAGPFSWQGEILTVMRRQAKDDEGQPLGDPTYFMRGKTKAEVDVIG